MLSRRRRLARALAALAALPLAQCGEGDGEEALAPAFAIVAGVPALREGETAQLAVAGASGVVRWSSSDPAVATVDFGLVRAVGRGTAIILALSGEQSAQLALTVTRPPLLQLSETAVAFEATAGAPPPAARALAVANAGDHPVEGLAVSAIAYGEGAAGWLTASVAPAAAPATLTLQPATTALPAGTHSATVHLASTTAANAPVAVAVSYAVAPAPVPRTIVLAPGAHEFVARAGLALPPALTVHVSAGGDEVAGLATSVEYEGSESGWLDVTQPGPTTTPATFTVRPTRTDLPPGTHSARVHVTSPAAGNSPQTLLVRYRVELLTLADVWPILDTATVRTATGAVIGCKGCHTGGTTAGGVPRLDLRTAAGFHASAVGQPAVLPVCGAMPKVAPGSPEGSCLRLMLESASAHLDRRITIADDPAALQRLYDWIRQGARP